MQTCSNCHSHVPDTISTCPTCQADLRESSTTAVALKRFQENSRVIMVNLVTSEEACTACQAVQGTYPKDQVPVLPVEGCSNPNGCHCFYQPLLDEIYP